MTGRREYDAIRRAASPLQLDLIESFVAGKLPRREFVRLGMLLGLSGATIAACGSANSLAKSTGTASQSTAVGVNNGGTANVKQGGVIKVASLPPAGALNPVKMQDFTSYGLIAQSYEFLIYTDGDLKLKPGLATEWKPNADATEWTFTLREGVTWMKDGSPLTADDVIATMERLVKNGNAALQGVIASGSVTSPDGKTIVFKLEGPNGNFPSLVSTDNAQCAILPKTHPEKGTLDVEQNGTGPWKIVSYDAKANAKFVRNEKWWGGKTPLDSQEWTFYGDLQAQVVALQSGQVDMIVQFSVLGGDALLNNSNLNIIALKASTHREVWMRCDTGDFKDARVREALAWTLDRDAMVKTLFKGQADAGADSVIAPVYPYADPSLPGRNKDIAKAKALLSSAGVDKITVDFNVVKSQEIPDLAALIKQNAAEAGITLNIKVEDGVTFYPGTWCPDKKKPSDPYCPGSGTIGIVDYGHRGTPDTYLNAALSSNGIWNSSHYYSKEFDAAFKAYEASIGVDAQKAACRKISDILQKDTPILVPYFYQYLSAHSKKFAGIGVTALSQLDLSKAGLVA